MFDFEYYPKSALAILAGCVVFLGVDALVALTSVKLDPMAYFSMFIGSIVAAPFMLYLLNGFEINKNIVYFILPSAGSVFLMIAPQSNVDIPMVAFSFILMVVAGFLQFVLPRMQAAQA